MTARYEFPVADDMTGFIQASEVAAGGSYVDLETPARQSLGHMPSYATTDLSTGLTFGDKTFKLFVKNLFDSRGEEWRYTACTTAICAPYAVYTIPVHPMEVGLKFGQAF